MKALYFLGIAILLVFVILSGFSYTFDPDELQNAHMVYLLDRGYVPFRDFFSVYTPILHVLLLPLFHLVGFTWSVLSWARGVMIGLFVLRLILSFRLIGGVFGNRVAYVFLPLLLIDPFTQFNAMQIRIDNLMMVFYMAGLLLLSYSLENNKVNTRRLFWSAILLSLSLITGMKVVIALFVVGLFMVWYAVKRRRLYVFGIYLVGLMVPVIAYGCVMGALGALPQMMTQLMFDAPLTNATRLFPTNPGMYYLPDNAYVYGLPGRPLNWMFANALPVLGFSGFASWILLKKHQSNSLPLGLLMAANLVVGWISLQFVPSLFLHYFLPVSWLYSVGAGLLVQSMYEYMQTRHWRRFVFASVVLTIGVLGLHAIRANYYRSRLTGEHTKRLYLALWEAIPAQESVFPGVLFRPPTHAIGAGYFFVEIPESIRKRYPSVIDTLEGQKVRQLFMSDYFLKFLDAPTVAYIHNNYEMRDKSLDLYFRKTSKL